MRRISKTSIKGRALDILRGNEGTSIVLVTIIAIIIITGIVILRITSSNLWASADKQYYQDQAYMMATSMGSSVDALIADGVINLSDYTAATTIITDNPSQIAGASVTVVVTPSTTGYVVEVEANAGNETYLYTAFYSRTAGSGVYTRQML